MSVRKSMKIATVSPQAATAPIFSAPYFLTHPRYFVFIFSHSQSSVMTSTLTLRRVVGRRRSSDVRVIFFFCFLFFCFTFTFLLHSSLKSCQHMPHTCGGGLGDSWVAMLQRYSVRRQTLTLAEIVTSWQTYHSISRIALVRLLFVKA